MDKVWHFLYELACWSVVLMIVVCFWWVFGRTIGGEAFEPDIFYSEQ